MRKYQNITLSLPKELIQKVKHIAVERNTSISALLTSLLEELVNREESYQKYIYNILNFQKKVLTLEQMEQSRGGEKIYMKESNYQFVDTNILVYAYDKSAGGKNT